MEPSAPIAAGQPSHVFIAAGKGGYEQQQQAEAWLAYIAWEKQNLQQQPPQQLSGQVSLAYECALTGLMHYPEACPLL